MSWFRSRVSKPGDLYCRALRIPKLFPLLSVRSFLGGKGAVVGPRARPRLCHYPRSLRRLVMATLPSRLNPEMTSAAVVVGLVGGDHDLERPWRASADCINGSGVPLRV